MAFILVQHLDPTHESHMVDLLTGHTSMPVRQAGNGMRIEPDQVYVIPPGKYLSVADGALRTTRPEARHGARLPIDFLLRSLAGECGARVVGVILSGTGADGSLGIESVHANGGLAIVQDPNEADYDGMPRSAIATGAVDMVLPVEKIPAAIANYGRRLARTHKTGVVRRKADPIAEIIELMRSQGAHDFTLYKSGTLQRRIERRMAVAGIPSADKGRYLELLKKDDNELDLLAKDLYINVTSFFRDRNVFDLLAKKIVPDLVRSHAADQPLRLWIAGCSTGEESYSLAMLFQEEIEAQGRPLKLQVFASDADEDAVARAREGVYPETTAVDVSPERLARFFSKETQGYKVLPDLRAAVVFTVQDVLADPPFSRIDMISCRNLLIYLGAEAQTKAIARFHFALREGGLLLLGSAESAGVDNDRFEAVSLADRLYRRIGPTRMGDFGHPAGAGDPLRVAARLRPGHGIAREVGYAELCRRLLVEAYAPAGVLLNRNYECLYFSGPTDQYLRVAPGNPTRDLFAMARQGMRTKLRSAIQRAGEENKRIVVSGGRTIHDGGEVLFSIAAQPVRSDDEELMLICFIDEPKQGGRRVRPRPPEEGSQVAELQHELDSVKTELQDAIRNLELTSEQQKTTIEEALAVNEEFQSTNEELLTSKEELQSLNEELTALNTQLEETLKLQRTTSNDLQNVLNSTDVATLFLDLDLNIRFFTPATKLLFGIIPGDIGRPIADLSSLAADTTLLDDARAVLHSYEPIEHEIEAKTGAWYLRRVLPYRSQSDHIEGVVVTYADVTVQRHAADLARAAERAAIQANMAKSRFLAAASHDLRQPLQTLSLLQGLLEQSVVGEDAKKLVAQLDSTLSSMSRMLNTLLDINQIESGTVHAKLIDFPINDVLDRMKTEFGYHAQAQKLALHVVPCSLTVRSDPRLLEQMLRNLLTNALKYTKRGKVLLGCRRQGDVLSIEVRDTGIGIPDSELKAIFDEYHQLDHAGHERGLGLGLSIVQRLSDFLGHRVQVRSKLGRGSAFTVDVPIVPRVSEPRRDRDLGGSDHVEGADEARRGGTVLILEDDRWVRELVERMLKREGFRAVSAADGAAGLELVERTIQPDLILADYNLPGDMNGLQAAMKIRESLARQIPVVILSGDISMDTLRDVARAGFVRLSKPVKFDELVKTVRGLLPILPPSTRPLSGDGTDDPDAPVVYVVDDDSEVRQWMRAVLEENGRNVRDFATCEEFLAAYRPGRAACLFVDAYMPGMSGIELLQRLGDAGHRLPAIMITGSSDVPMAVRAMKAGALDFLEKPVRHGDILAAVAQALDQSRDSGKLLEWRKAAAGRVAGLTARQRQIMTLVLAGHPSKNIAADLGISQRTVENHRAAIMKKMGAKSIPDLARLAFATAWDGDK